MLSAILIFVLFILAFIFLSFCTLFFLFFVHMKISRFFNPQIVSRYERRSRVFSYWDC